MSGDFLNKVGQDGRTFSEFLSDARNDMHDKGVTVDASTLLLALVESLKLQSHYAELLNMHDGGERMGFATPADWIKRLIEVGKIPKRGE